MPTKPEKGKKDEPQRRRRSKTHEADWGDANAELLQGVIALVCTDGRAIRFGYSRDGGAFAIGVYGDGKPYTEFLPGTQDVDEWLEGFRLDFE
jgi:hypothetical protein